MTCIVVLASLFPLLYLNRGDSSVGSLRESQHLLAAALVAIQHFEAVPPADEDALRTLAALATAAAAAEQGHRSSRALAGAQLGLQVKALGRVGR